MPATNDVLLCTSDSSKPVYSSGFRRLHRQKLKGIWNQVLQLIHSDSMQQFLLNHGNLLAISIANGMILFFQYTYSSSLIGLCLILFRNSYSSSVISIIEDNAMIFTQRKKKYFQKGGSFYTRGDFGVGLWFCLCR
jgi:hypothetical protein